MQGMSLPNFIALLFFSLKFSPSVPSVNRFETLKLQAALLLK